MKDCSHWCSSDGSHCWLKRDAYWRDRSMKLLERYGRLDHDARAHSIEEIGRLREKRFTMERMHINCTDEIDCKQRADVSAMVEDVERRMTVFIERLHK